jgi:ribosomal-protein-alanine N-acetyltransferase
MEFRTERLLLRPARADDLEPLHAIFSDPRAMAFWSSMPHGDLQTTRDWLVSMMAIQPEEGEDFILECDGELLGKAGLYRFPDIGYILHPDHWGRGYAREALTFVIDRAFEVHRLETIAADVDPRNERSLALLKKLHFRETRRAERTWEIGGEWYDSVYLALDPDDWRQSRA